MTRWSQEATDAVAEGMPWEIFSTRFPDFTYDAWEVKRRRVAPALPKLGVSVMAQPTGSYIGPSICYFDFETTYSSEPRFLSAAGVDGFGRLTVFDMRDYGGSSWIDDGPMAAAIRDYLESFDIIVSWNGKRFDLPVLNGRLAWHRSQTGDRIGFRPCNPQMHVDLMYYAGGQFMRIGSKALAHVSEFFDSPHRKTPLSPHLWDLADHGDMEAYDKIIEHNIADVFVTRDVWEHLSPQIRNIHRAS